jgi:VanZ family protein
MVEPKGPAMPLSRPSAIFQAVLLVGLAIHAALDELTQEYVGRSAEFFDWAADVSGVIAGLAVAQLVIRATQRANQIVIPRRGVT